MFNELIFIGLGYMIYVLTIGRIFLSKETKEIVEILDDYSHGVVIMPIIMTEEEPLESAETPPDYDIGKRIIDAVENARVPVKAIMEEDDKATEPVVCSEAAIEFEEGVFTEGNKPDAMAEAKKVVEAKIEAHAPTKISGHRNLEDIKADDTVEDQKLIEESYIKRNIERVESELEDKQTLPKPSTKIIVMHPGYDKEPLLLKITNSTSIHGSSSKFMIEQIEKEDYIKLEKFIKLKILRYSKEWRYLYNLLPIEVRQKF
jgi:hypothetical protein